MAENTRGRRQAGLQPKRPDPMEIEDERAMLATPERGGDEFGGSEEPIQLLPGDTIMAKVTHAIDLGEGDSWFTYGATSRILPGESEEEAYYRLSATVNSRVLDLVGDAADMIQERQAQWAAQQKAAEAERRRNRRIAVDGG